MAWRCEDADPSMIRVVCAQQALSTDSPAHWMLPCHTRSTASTHKTRCKLSNYASQIESPHSSTYIPGPALATRPWFVFLRIRKVMLKPLDKVSLGN